MATIHTFTGNEVIATEVPKYLNDNFSALNSVDEDIKTQLGAKAPLASPTLTGTPKAPTASQGTNTTQIATTAFVESAVKVKSVNGKTGDVVVGEITDASISGKVITLTKADGTTITLTTQDTNTTDTNLVMPDYSKAVTASSSKTTETYTMPYDGYCFYQFRSSGGDATLNIVINSVTIVSVTANYGNSHCDMLCAEKGTAITFQKPNNTATFELVVVPTKG